MTPCMCIHLDRIVRYFLQASRVAALSDSSKLGLDLLHAYLHVYDRFSRIEKATVTRPMPSLVSNGQT